MMDPRGGLGSIFAALSRAQSSLLPEETNGFGKRAQAHIPEQRLVIEPNQGR